MAPGDLEVDLERRRRFQDARATRDFTSSINVWHSVRLYFNVKNLANERYCIFEASTNRPIQREFHDRTFEGGVKFKF